ncbi:S-adenosyl-L-methionine-dependent methyltransferase [Stachybotrys elegans]|uniref:S-adenosyl-L-methionine-dependent methyltransferase n=1 Tax=Stachybotrys elegans TaxID=80388 RepID=A0A8K0WRN1_9HYPO|nr:S-adenosyl-L-methionine-dependent methyltransferase [Stachybotrys elegans]
MAYHEENGRTYHALAQGKYALPNDSTEIERLDIQHELLIRTLDGELSICPGSENAKRVLDIGTGTGAWAIDYGACHPAHPDGHPDAEVIGVDLSPIQPSFVPPNCRFEIDDLEEEWTWSVKFDFIMCRMMLGSFADFPRIVQKAYDNLEPGGWLEIQDLAIPARCDDETLAPDSYLMSWSNYILQAAANAGRPVFPVTEYVNYMKDAGFEEVVEVRRKWPTNTWPRDKNFKELGMWSYANFGRNLEGLSLAHFTRGLGWTAEATLLYCAETRKELKNPNIHAYWAMYFVYGRKPLKK